MLSPPQLRAKITSTAFTFRGYNVANLGKSADLLAHPLYGPHVEAGLHEASVIAGHLLGHRLDLVERVRSRRETSDLSTYAEDIALIVAMSLVQLKLLKEFFEVPFEQAALAFGYSLGEPTALVATGVYSLENILRPLLALARDSAELAEDVTMGVLFSRGPELDFTAVQRLCIEVTAAGQGVIAPMTYLSPNSALLLGQRNTMDEFKELMKDRLPERANLRKNPHRWPPLHTPITWQRSIPNRAGVILQTCHGGLRAPAVPLLSSVTGQRSFTDHNSRQLMQQWIDQPQRLWDMVFQTLASGAEVIVHVGPDPHLIPATFTRLSDNVAGQLAERSWSGLGLRAVAQFTRRPWLSRLLSQNAVPLRAPFVQQLLLEDWLLEQMPAPPQSS